MNEMILKLKSSFSWFFQLLQRSAMVFNHKNKKFQSVFNQIISKKPQFQALFANTTEIQVFIFIRFHLHKWLWFMWKYYWIHSWISMVKRKSIALRICAKRDNFKTPSFVKRSLNLGEILKFLCLQHNMLWKIYLNIYDTEKNYPKNKLLFGGYTMKFRRLPILMN